MEKSNEDNPGSWKAAYESCITLFRDRQQILDNELAEYNNNLLAPNREKKWKEIQEKVKSLQRLADNISGITNGTFIDPYAQETKTKKKKKKKKKKKTNDINININN
jgi:hypothetical protein